ncbi:MAG TPA: glycosyltransferase [Gemmatimonadales bacterium]|nr:glycosyltransferase [Gemmatimonadales bacterium]
MAETPRVSVVMPVHNGARYLERAIESILAQTFTDFEFVIVDDGSTDATPELLRRYQAADRRVRVHRQPQAGLAVSLNRGCSVARGTYLARMDADDIAFRERFARQVEFLDRHPAVAVVGTAVVRIDAAGREIKQSGGPTSHEEIVRALRQYTCFTHPSVMLRAAALAAVGGYRNAYAPAEDYDLWLRLSERYELANLPEPLLYYRVHPDQVSTRQLDQQILSVVGARTAAQQRARTGADRTPHDELITPRLLREWGVADAAVAAAMGEGYRYAAYLLQQAGCQREALELLRAGWHRAKGADRALERQYAAACWQEAKAARRAGRRWAGLHWGMRAWRAQPLLPLRLLRDRFVRARHDVGNAGAHL